MFTLPKPVFAKEDYVKDIDLSSLRYPGQPFDNKISISELLTNLKIIPLVFFLAGAFFLINLLSAAWTYVTSTGDPKKIAEATQRILNAFFGIVIVLASFVIVRIVLAVLGLSDLI